MSSDTKPKTEMSDPEPVQLRPGLALGVSVALWTVPLTLRLAAGGITFKQLFYEATWAVVAMGLSLACLAGAYRALTRRGIALTRACLLSTGASIPALMFSCLADYLLQASDPTLSLALPGQVSLPSAVLVSFADSFALSTFLAAIVFLPVLAVAHEQRRNELELLVREAELLLYRAQLEPHFVLNSLNAVAGLVEEDPPQARELLAALGDLFRDAAAFQATHRVRDEVAWLERYLTIHQLRYPDVLRVEWDVAADTRNLVMPALLLQPLVENAVNHGALRGGGHIAVRTRVVGKVLELVVEDDGPKLGNPRHGGRGLSIVQRRVKLEGRDAGSFALLRDGDRTVARVRLGTLVGGTDA